MSSHFKKCAFVYILFVVACWCFYAIGHLRGETAGIHWSRIQIYGDRE